MRQKYHFATDNGILIWDVTSILEDIEQHPESYTCLLYTSDAADEL